MKAIESDHVLDHRWTETRPHEDDLKADELSHAHMARGGSRGEPECSFGRWSRVRRMMLRHLSMAYEKWKAASMKEEMAALK